MIAKMKKITLLVSDKEREKFVSRLRKAGVVHISHVRQPESAHEVRFIDDKISKIKKIIEEISPYEEHRGNTDGYPCSEKDVMDRVEAINRDTREKADLVARIDALRKEMLWFEEWGEVDPGDIDLLKDKGLFVRLYVLSKEELGSLSKEDVERAQNERRYHVLKTVKGAKHIVIFSEKDEPEIPFDPVVLPTRSLQEQKELIEKLEEQVRAIDKEMIEKAHYLDSVKRVLAKLENELEFQTVKCGMAEEGKFAYLQGFCPEKKIEKITKIAKQQGAGYFFEDPSPEEEVPTHITNPKWLRIINPVFQFMNTVPGYHEFDISFVFMIFFSLFFAMLVGDAGYGIIFVVVTFLARMKFRKAPYEPFFLMYLLGGATIVWGVITGTWFGSEALAQIPVLKKMVIPQLDSFSVVSQDNIIFLSFTIGAIHLTIAHLLKATRVINSIRALADVGWSLIVWGMYFAAGKFVLGNAFPPFAGWLLISGIIMVLVFTKAGIKGMLDTLTSLPLSVISSFSDVVSYLRLFAVGFSTVVLAETFNNMALQGEINGIVAGLIAAIILFLGHTLNILLAMMAVIVHGIRLNMLEFSSHLGMQWSGKNYDPFREKGKEIEA